METEQEYTIKEWSPWTDRETGQPVTDKHGNHRGSVVFEEHQNEPVDATFKPPVQVGQKKYGVVEEYTTQGGSFRIRFQRRDKPQELRQTSAFPAKSEKTWQPRDDDAIRAQWAIGQSVQWTLRAPETTADDIEQWAKRFYAMVDRVKSGEVVKVTENVGTSAETTKYVERSGYERFKQSRPTAQNPDPEFQSMLAKGLEADGIDPEDIPPEFR